MDIVGWPKWYYEPGKGTLNGVICNTASDVPTGWSETPSGPPAPVDAAFPPDPNGPGGAAQAAEVLQTPRVVAIQAQLDDARAQLTDALGQLAAMSAQLDAGRQAQAQLDAIGQELEAMRAALGASETLSSAYETRLKEIDPSFDQAKVDADEEKVDELAPPKAKRAKKAAAS